ncbi:MAG: hypothetical protein Q7T21_04145 [Gallionella sp.]|nr:hypothetical protein [Gallionella sp.]
MSGLLAIFYWIVIPVFVFLIARWLFRRVTTQFQKRAVVAVSVVVSLGLLWLATGEKWWLDYQVRELCAKDGGVKVYETVKLPPEMFNKYGQINFYRPDQGENALGTEYVFKRETVYYKQGNPDFFRLYTRVFRRSDGRLLGESVFYKRGGGDLPGPWHGTSFMCPLLSVKTDALRQIFVINNKE